MSSNPLIQDLIENEAFPSVTVCLPTGGRWYEDGVLAEGADPMDLPVGVLGILAEQNYRDPLLLLSGEAIPRMLKGVCPSIVEAGALCEIDLEAILLASRLVSYGPKIVITHSCDNAVPKTEEEIAEEKEKSEEENPVVSPTKLCNHENKIDIDVNEHILRYTLISDEVVAEKLTHTLTKVNQTVHLRPPPYSRAIAMMREGVAREKQVSTLNDIDVEDMVVSEEAISRYVTIIDMASESALENMEASIHAISTSDGTLVNGREFIREWLLALPSDEADAIVAKINEMTLWLLSFTEIKYTCPACEADQKFRLELDANRLFGQAGDSTQPKKPSRKSRSGARKRRIQ